MCRVRLRVDDLDSLTRSRNRLHDAVTNATIRLPVLRLSTRVRVGRDGEPDRREYAAWLDTGSWITVIRYHDWREMEDDGQLERLEALPFLDGSPAAGTTTLGGNRGTPVEYGRVWLSVLDPGPAWGGVVEALPAVPVIAQLLLDPTARLPVPVLLGLHAGVLNGRRLTRLPTASAPTPRGDRQSDVGGYYLQQWWLHDE